MNDDIDEILDNFDFEKVKKVMDALEWVYWDSEEYTVSIYELRKTARSLLKQVYSFDPAEYSVSASGGFEATRCMCPGDPKKYLSLKFVVTEWNNAD